MFLQHHGAVASQSGHVLDLLRQQGETLETIAAAVKTLAPPEAAPWRDARRHSYSTEAEDLLIDRLLTAVVGLPHDHVGHYLDIGAYHPMFHSNTYAFYERGWSGICVEPDPAHHAQFAGIRPRDKALNFGLDGETKTLRYHRFANAGLNGFYEQSLADFHVREGQAYLGHQDIECLGVRAFLSEYVTVDVDFMDIDVEMLEAELLRAWDWTLCRPKVICAEVHSLGLREMLASDIATILREAGYTAMSRGWQSAIFVADEEMARFMGSARSSGIREIIMGRPA